MFPFVVLSSLHIAVGPPVRGPELLSDCARTSLYKHYNAVQKQVYYCTERAKPTDMAFLSHRAQFYSYILLDGRRITPLIESRNHSASAAVVKVILDDKMHVGEVLRVFHHAQEGIADQSTVYVEIRWMVHRLLSPIEDDPWSDLYIQRQLSIFMLT